MLRFIPIFKGCNRQVEILDKRHCSLTTVPDDIFRYSRCLEELFLDSNHIRDLPKNLFRLTKLRKLTLSDNEIHKLPFDVENFENLVEFDISRNDIPDIPETIGSLKRLQLLDCSSNPITQLPRNIIQLTNLRILSLSDMSLMSLPNDLGLLNLLESLELRENLLKFLPPSIAKLSKLERLDLGDNEIDELPSEIGNLPNLQELWLDHNQLQHLPASIGNLKNLLYLDVSENRLEDIPDEINGLENLTDLLLSQNTISSLPNGIGYLKKLTILKVDQNRLTYLNHKIGNCIRIQELILTENFLIELPTSIGNLIELNNLNVDRNNLNCLPKEIGNLQRLGVLSLRDNKLKYLPIELGDCSALHVLDVSGNRLQYLPSSLLKLDLKAVWLSENQAQPVLSFQNEYDEESGDEVLTCFLLPQLEECQHSDTTTETRSAIISTPGILDWRKRFDHDSLRNNYDECTNMNYDDNDMSRSHSVKFTEDAVSDNKETALVRQKTPYSKELKAKAQRLFNKESSSIHDLEENKHDNSSDNISPIEDQSSVSNNNNDGVDNNDNQINTYHLDLPVSNNPKLHKFDNESNYSTPPESISIHSQGDSEPVLELQEEKYEIHIERTASGLGLSIAGGLGSTPYKKDDYGIFISRITSGGPADLAGLKVNDKVLTANGISLLNIKHVDAVNVLRNSGPILILQISREVTRLSNRPISQSISGGKLSSIDSTALFPVSYSISSRTPSRTSFISNTNTNDNNSFEGGDTFSRKYLNNNIEQPKDSTTTKVLMDNDLVWKKILVHTTLIRDIHGLGFTIAGSTDGITVSKITNGGVAYRDGKLQVNDRIKSINGIDMTNASHQQAVQMLTGFERFIRLIVERDVLVPRDHFINSSLSTNKSINNITDINGLSNRKLCEDEIIENNQKISPNSPVNDKRIPQPAPRRINSVIYSEDDEVIFTKPVDKKPMDGGQQSHFRKPITNEDFQAMIPKHFLQPSNSNSSENSGSMINVTIKQPEVKVNNEIQLPPTTTTLGKVTETITKSTFTETTVTRLTENKLAVVIEEVILQKTGPLGFSIIGGTDHSCVPFGVKEPGIFVSHLVPDGLAAASGKIQMGDRILKVNGTDVTNATHQEAVMELLRPCDEIKLTIRHDHLPDGFQELTISKQPGEKLGMHIKGGLCGQKGNPLDLSDEGVFISKINSGGAARRDKRLKVGMRLLEVNGISLLGATHQEAVNALRNSGDKIRLIICNGYDRSEVDRLIYEGRLQRISATSDKCSSSRSISVSSLDKEDDNTNAIKQEQEMKKELMEWEHEENSKKTKEVIEYIPEDLTLIEYREKTTPDKVLDVVKAVEQLVRPISPSDSLECPKSPGALTSEVKTTTIVMSKHSLEPQNGTVTPPQTPKPVTPKLSVSAKKKFFEDVIEDVTKPSPKTEKVFSFLSPDEIEKLKAEEDRKLASLSHDINSWTSDDNNDDNEILNQMIISQKNGVNKEILEKGPKYKINDEEYSDENISLNDQRTLKAEQRAAWRHARLKSLEQDAIQAQIIIESVNELINNSNSSNPDLFDSVEKKTNCQVETLEEKIISLELASPEEKLQGNEILNGIVLSSLNSDNKFDTEDGHETCDDLSSPMVSPDNEMKTFESSLASSINNNSLNTKKKRKRKPKNKK